METLLYLQQYLQTSVEILADISEPEIPPNETKVQKIQFSSCIFRFNGRIKNFPLKPE